MPPRPTLADALRRAIAADGRPPSTLATDAGVSPATLSRFLTRRMEGINLATLERLVEALGLRLELTKGD